MFQVVGKEGLLLGGVKFVLGLRFTEYICGATDAKTESVLSPCAFSVECDCP